LPPAPPASTLQPMVVLARRTTRARDLGRGEGGGMRTSAARWTVGTIAVTSVALMAAGLALAFVDRHRCPPA
jgi:anti-sigma-K factor RskA